MALAVVILLVTFLVLLALDVPVAFCIGLATLFSMFAMVDFIPAISTVAQRVATGLDSFTLLAIPFFILAGNIMGRGGIAHRLIALARALVGSLPGGLAFVNVIANMLFGAISGSAIASAVAIGGVMHPRMVRSGYGAGYSAAVNVTSATTGLVIPPSNVLIIYSLASGGVSVAALFVAGYLPGLLMGMALMIVAGVVAYRRGFRTDERVPLTEVARRLLDALPSLGLIIVVIGGIVAGIFTATEAAAIAVLYALVLSVGIYREIRLRELFDVLLHSVVTTAVVMLLIATSMALSWALSFERIPQEVGEALVSVSENPVVLLLLVNVMLLLVGTFMDMTPAILIFTPIFLPVAVQMGVDPVHFGILMVVNLCIGLCTPPVGTVLFAGCSVAGVPVSGIVRPLLPLYIALLLALLIVTFVPALTLWLPGVFGL
ncbi:TRAP transporter large permease [Rhodocaloribacter litoris]|uniref:TRAP transporter large permease n=1 Tax=Rhodocaloribacter litoris TaxID=2558931 RepID=UPI0014249568|nr:TRAP transporter large permease [Rhodocaloribacter litoris]QXD14101.1 TRAP transporter large permease [Rhodocaloribacter litoris]